MLKQIRNSIGAVALLALAGCQASSLSDSAVSKLQSSGFVQTTGGVTRVGGPEGVATYQCPPDRCGSLTLITGFRFTMTNSDGSETIEQLLRNPRMTATEAVRLTQANVKFDEQPARSVSPRLIRSSNLVALDLFASGRSRDGKVRYFASRVSFVGNVGTSIGAFAESPAAARRALQLALSN